jgi:hypothetical protein
MQSVSNLLFITSLHMAFAQSRIWDKQGVTNKKINKWKIKGSFAGGCASANDTIQ